MSFFSKKWLMVICPQTSMRGITSGQTAPSAPDTRAVSRKEVENIFLSENYLLLAPTNNITIAEPGIKQSYLEAKPKYTSRFYTPPQLH